MYIYILNKYTLGNLTSPKHVFEFKKHPPVMGHMEGGGGVGFVGWRPPQIFENFYYYTSLFSHEYFKVIKICPSKSFFKNEVFAPKYKYQESPYIWPDT